MNDGKPLSNSALDDFIHGADNKTKKPWEGLDPNAKRTGTKSYTFPLNEYEWTLLEEAAKEEGSTKAGLIRRALLRRCKTILDIG